MSIRNTRVNLSLPDEVVRVLDRMSKVTGAGRATIIREWLIEGLPHFVEMATAMEMAQQRNIDAFKVVSTTLRDLTDRTSQIELDLKKHRAAMRKRKRD
ncbi:MAG: ribbon-helix-helix protein, CopG family [Caldilineaceae bacterium]|nr:ribbon-helix-helix protein, CopG family [Caldilineaceae bacterium]